MGNGLRITDPFMFWSSRATSPEMCSPLPKGTGTPINGVPFIPVTLIHGIDNSNKDQADRGLGLCQ